MRLIVGLGVIALSFSTAWARVRKVEVVGDQVVTVRTATNIATIIQVPDKPNSLVVGDQNSFKVEYLDRAITIKPLHSRARSNLFIYTDSRRFNVQLVTEGEAAADYVVYLENVRKPPVAEARATLTERLTNGSLTIEMVRGRRAGSVVSLEFRIKSASRDVFKPEWVWITQRGATVPIHLLAFETAEIGPGRRVNGIVQIRTGDFELGSPLRLELRRKKISYLTVPKVSSWK